MNYQSSNGVTISGTRVLINGKEVPIPDSLRNQLQNGICRISNKKDTIYINGFEYLGNGEWEKTISALFHKYF